MNGALPLSWMHGCAEGNKLSTYVDMALISSPLCWHCNCRKYLKLCSRSELFYHIVLYKFLHFINSIPFIYLVLPQSSILTKSLFSYSTLVLDDWAECVSNQFIINCVVTTWHYCTVLVFECSRLFIVHDRMVYAKHYCTIHFVQLHWETYSTFMF